MYTVEQAPAFVSGRALHIRETGKRKHQRCAQYCGLVVCGTVVHFSIMNHNSGFIIGITYAKPLIEHTHKNKCPSTKHLSGGSLQ